ncbi:MAG TPA: 2-oxoacid:acceptor oxidoreductase family protein [Acidimicrobiales bacterium]|nr:2-oxoacid:acceptor oxidoreductase family protein [Acidimicrobiales bacterium]
MQVEVLLTGIGGQGIQLSAKTLALAAVAEGRQAMMCGQYAGAMRGGQTDATVVVADGSLRALPILPSAWSAFVMSAEYWEPTRARIRPGGIAVANGSLIGSDLPHDGIELFLVPAGRIATELSAPMSASYVLLGAYAAITGLVGVDALIGAMKEMVPSYRTQHLAANEAALRAGAEAGPVGAAPAWAGRLDRSGPVAAAGGASR